MVGSFLSRGNARDQCLEAAGTSRATLRNVSKFLTAGNMHQNRHKGEENVSKCWSAEPFLSVEFTVFIFFSFLSVCRKFWKPKLFLSVYPSL